MFCKKCGAKSDGTKKFCTNCGNQFAVQAEAPVAPVQTRVADYTATPKSAPMTPPVTTIHRPPMPKEKWTAWKVVKAVIAVVFVLGLIILKFGMAAINSVDNKAVDKNNTGMSAYESGDGQQAIDQFKQAADDAVTNTTKMTTLINLAYAYDSEGKTELAESAFKDALALAPEGSSKYYFLSGKVALFEGKPNSALVAYNKALELDSEDFQINNALNMFYLDLADERPQYSDYAKALKYAIKANQLSPSEITKQNLAISYYFNDNYKQAISLLTTSANISSQPYLAYWLGLSYAGDDQSTNAKYYLKMAINGGVDVPQEVMDYINNN